MQQTRRALDVFTNIGDMTSKEIAEKNAQDYPDEPVSVAGEPGQPIPQTIQSNTNHTKSDETNPEAYTLGESSFLSDLKKSQQKLQNHFGK